MPAPKATIWKLEPHTKAKHAILRRYLRAWTPILTQSGFPKIAYVDGFAGPGQYEGGEDGSPIIALRAAMEHADRIRSEVVFLFIEERQDRAEFLETRIRSLAPPENFKIKTEGGVTFEEAFNEFRKWHADQQGRLPPTFAFIDPFGWSGVPFSVVRFILGQRSCEVFITFMYEEINRFIGHPDQEANFDTFFGTRDWRATENLTKPIERLRFLHDLYLAQLRLSAKYARSFQMRNTSGTVDYYLFYATNNLTGLKKMKEAMWKVDPSGEFMFSDATDPNQMILFGSEPRYELLKGDILAKFGGQEATVKEIEEFVLAETAFRETHYKVQVLRPLELDSPPRLQPLNAPPNRRPGTFASPTLRLRFA